MPAVKEDVYGVYTNTTPVEAYRGAGRPEATFMLERMMDKLAATLKMDPVDVRRKNMIPPLRERPQRRSPDSTYDSGNYPAALEQGARPRRVRRACAREQADARKQGRYLGIGVATYVEICGLGPSQVAGAIGFQGGLWESAIVRFHPTGKVHVFIGASPHGQGEETTFAQIVADELGVGVNDVKVVHGDTDDDADGMGHLRQPHDRGRRRRAVRSRRARSRRRRSCSRAHLLEAAVEDIDYADGKFFVKGVPGQAQDDPGHRADGQRRVEHAAGHGSRARGDDLLRSAELRLSVRRARRGRRSRSGDRRASS